MSNRSNKIYSIIKKVSYVVISIVILSLIIDIFFADNLGFGRNKIFIYYEGILFVLFLFFEILKWYYKKKTSK